jgi:GNAT superfamily N-acetyltransferase
MITIRQISTAADAEAAGQLVRAVTTWSISLDPEAAENAPTFAGLDAEIASIAVKYAPPSGCFLIARDEGAPVGCVAYLSQGNGVVELKRMYVDPGQRGKGTGSMLVKALIDIAKRNGARRMILDSYHTMHSAHRIYRGLGFRDVTAPPGFPQDLIAKVVFMELDLT